MFKTNVGGIDRTLRIVVGAALIAIFALAKFGVLDATGWMGSPWLLIGLVPFLTGLMSSCPVYSIIGVKTCPTNNE